MNLEEIESKIAALKKRKAELETKTLRLADGTWDTDVMAAEGAVDKELDRLSALRTKALAGVEDDGASPAQLPQHSAPPAWTMPVGFKSNTGDDVNPLDGIDAVPTGETFRDLTGKLFNFTLNRTVRHIDRFRQSLKSGNRPVLYTEGQHSGMLATLAFMQSEYRLLAAYGRDRRKEVETRLLARIEALEARPTLKYVGVWNAETQNNEGEFATHRGGIWYCKRSTRQKPGTGDDWQLAVKSGEGAR